MKNLINLTVRWSHNRFFPLRGLAAPNGFGNHLVRDGISVNITPLDFTDPRPGGSASSRVRFVVCRFRVGPHLGGSRRGDSASWAIASGWVRIMSEPSLSADLICPGQTHFPRNLLKSKKPWQDSSFHQQGGSSMTVLLNKPVAHARGRRAAAPRWLRWRRTAPARPSARPPRAPRAKALRSLARARWSPRTPCGAGVPARLRVSTTPTETRSPTATRPLHAPDSSWFCIFAPMSSK